MGLKLTYMGLKLSYMELKLVKSVPSYKRFHPQKLFEDLCIFLHTNSLKVIVPDLISENYRQIISHLYTLYSNYFDLLF